MLDINFIRENKSAVKKNIKRRGVDSEKADIDAILKYDKIRKEAQQQLEEINRQRNLAAKARLFEKGRDLKSQAKDLETRITALDKLIFEHWQWVPNMLSDDTPDGKDDSSNIEIKVWLPDKGYLSKNKLGVGNNASRYMEKKEGLDHIELGKKLDIIDLEQSAIVSGSRFAFLKNEAVLLQYAIFDLLFKKLVKEGFHPIVPPLLVKEAALFGTSHFPEGKDQVYKIENTNVEEKQDLFLVGSSEPALFAYGMNRAFKRDDLPYKMTAFTPCFRSEVGSWGKDVKGIKRVHQFDKLEMDVICAPSQSSLVFDELVAINEWLVQELKLPYRIVQKCSGDAGYLATHKQYDVEVWRPTVGEFMETMTATNATDYQARRLNIRVELENGRKDYAHTVNDTGAAMGRLIMAILENYQREDGGVAIPSVLQKYLGSKVIMPNFKAQSSKK